MCVRKRWFNLQVLGGQRGVREQSSPWSWHNLGTRGHLLCDGRDEKKEIKVCENTRGLPWQSQGDVVNRECRDLFGQISGVTQCYFCPLDNSIGECLRSLKTAPKTIVGIHIWLVTPQNKCKTRQKSSGVQSYQCLSLLSFALLLLLAKPNCS